MRGGPRAGAGRKHSRLSVQVTAAILADLAAGGTLADLARRLGLTRQAVNSVRALGISPERAAMWRERLLRVSSDLA